MPRFFVRDFDLGKDRIEVKGDEFLHMKKVLRLKPGDWVEIINGRGLKGKGMILEMNGSRADIRLYEQERLEEEGVYIILGQSLPKHGKMDFVVQKSVELGVSEIFPFYSVRSIPRLDREGSIRKRDRWERIAIQACKQSDRTWLPVIREIKDYEDFLKYSKKWDALRIILWERGKRGLKDILKENKKGCVILAIGPEGGFLEEEVELAVRYGFLPIGLGRRILRTETAGISVISIIQYEMGDLG